MHGAYALVGGVQCKLVPAVDVTVLMVTHVSLHSRLSSGAGSLCARKRKIKDKRFEEWEKI